MIKKLASVLFFLCLGLQVVNAISDGKRFEVWRILAINGRYDGTYYDFLGDLNREAISANTLWNALLDCYDGTCEAELIYTNYVQFYSDVFGVPSKEIETKQVRDNVRVISYSHPIYQGIAYTGNNSINSNWYAVARWLYSYYGRSIYNDVSEGYNFTTKGLQTISTFKYGKQLIFNYNISFDFKNGRVKYTVTITDYVFDKRYDASGTENYEELSTEPSFVYKHIAKTINNYMSGLTTYLFNDNDW